MINTDYILHTWIPLLRSGKYEQCQYLLIDDDGRRCAVGVLIPDEDNIGSSLGQIGAKLGVYPLNVACTIDGKTATVPHHNNNGATFAQIADALEARALAEQADQLVRAHQAEPALVTEVAR